MGQPNFELGEVEGRGGGGQCSYKRMLFLSWVNAHAGRMATYIHGQLYYLGHYNSMVPVCTCKAVLAITTRGYSVVDGVPAY